MMVDAIVISDLHLSSEMCQVKLLEEFLGDINNGIIETKELILNGDVFDNFDFSRLKKRHWNVLSLIRKMSDEIKITVTLGNHDIGIIELVSCLLGVEVGNDYVLKSGEKTIYLHHGHKYDKFIT